MFIYQGIDEKSDILEDDHGRAPPSLLTYAKTIGRPKGNSHFCRRYSRIIVLPLMAAFLGVAIRRGEMVETWIGTRQLR